MRITPWEALGDLGERADLPELRDVGGALALVADDGAKVRDSLTARASTMRRRQLADAEGDAQQADESMRIAQLVLALGFWCSSATQPSSTSWPCDDPPPNLTDATPAADNPSPDGRFDHVQMTKTTGGRRMRTVLSWAQYLRGMTDQLMAARDERGEGVVTNVIWIALFAAAAIGIATIIIAKFTGKAESIPTG